MRPLVLANPGRRLDAFLAAHDELGRVRCEVLLHRELLGDVDVLDRYGEAVDLRVDSFGEDPEVERALLQLGRDPDGVEARARARGELFAPAQLTRGWVRQLAALQRALATRPSWRLWSPSWALAELFDKRQSSRRLRAAGIPVAEALEPAQTVAALRSGLAARGWRRAFVKLASGSAAAGILVLERERERAVTTLEREGDRWFNTRRLVELRTREDIDAALAFLVGEGAQVEEAVELARVHGQRFDLRVLVIAGEPAFVVARCSAQPMTNLHLGGVRAELDEVRAIVPAQAWRAALDAAVGAAAVYGCHQLGVDVGFEARTWRPVVFEANAFGDYLPGLRREGLSVLAWELSRRR